MSVIDPIPLEHPRLSMAQRRAIFAILCAATITALISLMAAALLPGGLGFLDLLFILLFTVTLPWTVIGFWNAVIGFLIMRFADDPLDEVNPPAARIRGDEAITTSTAILLCIRNERPERIIRNTEAMLRSLAASGHGARFHLYVLSDTGKAEIAAIEDGQFAKLAADWEGRIGITYRRRESNTGYKAGNVRDFCERWGGQHDFALTLDADSFMTANAMLRLVRIMQADPNLGILQSLVVGLPSASAFARLFQFGMRLGMRSYTTGATWWQGDCGPYWGHNAVFRIAPFYEYCHLPPLPDDAIFGGQVLSHDQIEAVLMRRAGYEVRVLPAEDHSWEENPPTLIEFIRRDLRWCQGNMQYWHFLRLPGLRFVSRYQLIFALLMFLGSPAWILMLLQGASAAALTPDLSDIIDPVLGIALFTIVFVMWFTPKYASVADVLTRTDARQSFGGLGWFFLGTFVETIFSILLVPIMWFGHTLFLVALLLGRSIGWSGQIRDDHAVSWSMAAQNLWPQSLLGAATIVLLAFTQPAAIPFALFIAGGLALAIPFAVVTSSPALGRWLNDLLFCGLPEEIEGTPALRERMQPALDAAPAPAPLL